MCRGKCCVCGEKTFKRAEERGAGILFFADLCERHYDEWLRPGARIAQLVVREALPLTDGTPNVNDADQGA